MSHSRIDFQGSWPEMLQAEVEDLILQYDPLADEAPSDKSTAWSRLPQACRWIAQHNPAPTGPLYAVGRPGRNGQAALGPVVSASGSELLDKLRALLSALGGRARYDS